MSLLGYDLTSARDISHPWWKPMVSLINFVLLGYCLKSYFRWDRQKTASFRRFTFNILLPAYVLRNMWMAHIDSSMYDIAKVSFLLHLMQSCFWWCLYRNVPESSMRGWLSMISQGCLTSFFYTNLSNHGAFGQQAIAICLLWDIGGNTPCCQLLLWGIAAFHAPLNRSQKVDTSFGSANSRPLLQAPGRRKEDMYPHFFHLTQKGVAESRPDEEDTTECTFLLDEEHTPTETNTAAKSWLEVLSSVLFQPILPAFLIGLFLSLYSIGCPIVVDLSLEAIGLLFKPCLYFLIGLYSDIITDPQELRIVFTVIGLRYLFAAFIGLAMWLWLPFPSLERTTMALSLLSPVSTMTIYLSAEYGYPNHFLSMSAAITTISVFLSFGIQEIVMRSY